MSGPSGPSPTTTRETATQRATERRIVECVDRFEQLLKRSLHEQTPDAVNIAVAKIVLPGHLLTFLA